jgi:hypothetical protein
MVEFILALPILASMIALTFLSGYIMVNQQEVMVAARYVPWRSVQAEQSTSADELNTLFFQDRAIALTLNVGSGPPDTLELLVSLAGSLSADAGILIDDSLFGDGPRWSHGRSAEIGAEFPVLKGKLRSGFTGKLWRRHFRDGDTWNRNAHRKTAYDDVDWGVSYLDAIRNQFLYGLDSEITAFPNETLSDALRSIYSQDW